MAIQLAERPPSLQLNYINYKAASATLPSWLRRRRSELKRSQQAAAVPEFSLRGYQEVWAEETAGSGSTRAMQPSQCDNSCLPFITRRLARDCCGNLQVAVERIWASMNVAAAVGGAEMGFEYGTASVGLRTVLGGGGGGGGGGEGGGPAAGNWVVAAPTNAGKTAIFIEITK